MKNLELNYVQTRGEKCSYNDKPSEDVGVFYTNEYIGDASSATEHLMMLDRKLSDAVDQKESKGEVLSTWSATVLTPKGDLVWASRGDSPVVVFTYDKLTKKAQGKIVNNLHNPQKEIAYLSSLENLTESQEQRLKTLKASIRSDDRIGYINGATTLARGFGDGRYVEKGFLHESEFGVLNITPSENERVFIATSSDGIFELSMSFNEVKTRKVVGTSIEEQEQDADNTEFLAILADGLEHKLVPHFEFYDELNSLHIDGVEINMNGENFIYKGVQHKVTSSLRERLGDGEYRITLVGRTNDENFGMERYCEIVEECIEKNELVHEKIKDFAKLYSRDDMLFSCIEVTNLPAVSIVSHVFDGTIGQEVSKQCGELTTEFAKATGSNNINTVIAETKDDPERVGCISVEGLATGRFTSMVSQESSAGWTR